MSLPAMSFEDWFCVSRKGGTGGGVLLLYGFGCENLNIVLGKMVCPEKFVQATHVVCDSAFNVRLLFSESMVDKTVAYIHLHC